MELHYPVTGIVSAKVSVSGTKQDLEGNGTLAVSHGSAWNEPLNKLAVDEQFEQGSVHSVIDIEIPAGKILADATYKLATQEYDAKLHADGLKLDGISALQRGGKIGGVLNISASGRGTIQDPELEVNLAVPQLQIHECPVSNLTAQVTVAHEHGNLTLHSVVDQGSVDVKGNVELTGQRNATGTVDVKALPIAAVLANFVPAQSSNVKGHGNSSEFSRSAQSPGAAASAFGDSHARRRLRRSANRARASVESRLSRWNGHAGAGPASRYGNEPHLRRHNTIEE